MRPFITSLAVCAFGFFLLGSAVTAEAAPLTPSQVSAVVSLLQSFGTGTTTLQSVQSILTLSAPRPAITVFSAMPQTGAVPLDVALSATGLVRGSEYLLIFGDGTRSSAYLAIDGSIATGHTYAKVGTYTVAVLPYVACMWATPACALKLQPVASATIIAR